jgi:hypothetical protein
MKPPRTVWRSPAGEGFFSGWEGAGIGMSRNVSPSLMHGTQDRTQSILFCVAGVRMRKERGEGNPCGKPLILTVTSSSYFQLFVNWPSEEDVLRVRIGI